MLYPITGSNRICSAFAPASVIANQGPGNLYLYRNSAVSAAAYDAVIGPGGNAQWPGGELWVNSDVGGTIANVLNAGAAIDSGSVAISGTVTTVAGGTVAPVTDPALRASSTGTMYIGTATTTANFQCPSETKAGDLIVVFVEGYQGANPPSVNSISSANSSGSWTLMGQRSSPDNTWAFSAWKVATALDEGGNTFTFTTANIMSDLTFITGAFTNATTITRIADSAFITSNTSATLSTGTTMGSKGLGIGWMAAPGAYNGGNAYTGGSFVWPTLPAGTAAWAVAAAVTAASNGSGAQRLWSTLVKWTAGAAYDITATTGPNRSLFHLYWIR